MEAGLGVSQAKTGPDHPCPPPWALEPPRGPGGSGLPDSPPAPASSPQRPEKGCGESEDGGGGRGALASGGGALQPGGLCGVPGRGTQDSGEGPGAACEGESRPESSTFSGEEEEKGEGLEVKPRLLEPGGGRREVVAPGPAHPSTSPFGDSSHFP